MDITSFSCPSKDTILQNTMNKLESIWDEISYPKGFILFTKDKIERDVYLMIRLTNIKYYHSVYQ